MKNVSNKRIKTGLLTAALAGGTILGATQVGGIVNAQTDDTTADDTTVDDSGDHDGNRQERRQERRENRQESMQEVAALIGVEVDALGDWLRNGGTLAEVATANGVEPSAVVDLMVANANERIDQAVADGRIDATEADEKKAEAQERITTLVNEGPAELPGREAREERREERQERRQESAQEMADLLGIDVDTLGEQLRNGDTLAEIAEQNGVDPQVVVDLHRREQRPSGSMQAVENGRIDAAAAEERLADLESESPPGSTRAAPSVAKARASAPAVSTALHGGGEGAPAEAPASRRRRQLSPPLTTASPQRCGLGRPPSAGRALGAPADPCPRLSPTCRPS